VITNDAPAGVVEQKDAGCVDVPDLESGIVHGDDFPFTVLVGGILPGKGFLSADIVINVVARKLVLDLVDVVGDRGDEPIPVRIRRLLP